MYFLIDTAFQLLFEDSRAENNGNRAGALWMVSIIHRLQARIWTEFGEFPNSVKS